MAYKIIILTLINALAMIQNQSSLEKRIWEMEASYWNSIKNKNVETYSSLLHPKFSDWPGFLETPVLNPETMIETVKSIQSEIDEFDYKLEPKGISIVSGNEVIVYFNCQIFIKNQEGEINEHTHRMIHIWTKEKNEWLLMAGLQTP